MTNAYQSRMSLNFECHTACKLRIDRRKNPTHLIPHPTFSSEQFSNDISHLVLLGRLQSICSTWSHNYAAQSPLLDGSVRIHILFAIAVAQRGDLYSCHLDIHACVCTAYTCGFFRGILLLGGGMQNLNGLDAVSPLATRVIRSMDFHWQLQDPTYIKRGPKAPFV